MRVILASASPRRAELLKAAGFDVDIVPSHVAEQRFDGEHPEAYVIRLASEKAAAVARHRHDLPIVAADTVVVLDEDVLEKPRSDREAALMLRMLAGRSHEVLTGIVVRHGGEQRVHVARTTVRMADLTADEIAWYVATGEPRDKAGGYAVQGLASRFIEAIDGSYSNVVGLPVAVVYRLVAEVTRHETPVDPAP